MVNLNDVTKLIVKGQVIEELLAITNTGEYSSEDVVGIAVASGDRQARHTMDLEEVMLAVSARAKIVTDNRQHRAHPHNGGSREIARFLRAMRYAEKNLSGIWHPTCL